MQMTPDTKQTYVLSHVLVARTEGPAGSSRVASPRLPHAPFSFAEFNLHGFAVINCDREYNRFLSCVSLCVGLLNY